MVSAKVGPDRPDPMQVLHGPPALNANCTTIGAPLAGVTVAIRITGSTLLMTPVIVVSPPSAQAIAAINNRPVVMATTALFAFIVVPPRVDEAGVQLLGSRTGSMLGSTGDHTSVQDPPQGTT